MLGPMAARAVMATVPRATSTHLSDALNQLVGPILSPHKNVYAWNISKYRSALKTISQTSQTYRPR
jgi:hypothetical protein